MKIVLFYHSFLSCWNHGNAHFLRGIARELIRLNNDVVVYEPADGWSRTNAVADGGLETLTEAAQLVPGVQVRSYRDVDLDLEEATDGADLVIVHEWNTPSLVAALGRQRIAGAPFLLMFHDTHHRAVTAPGDMDALDLDGYDAVLAFGEVLRQIYVDRGWGRRAFTWHEAADTALFHPRPATLKDTDVIWIGNWGDEERTAELKSLLIEPVSRLGLEACVYGVRYPPAARQLLLDRGLSYRGWLPNHRVPSRYARARATIHIPRRPYAEALPGIPTIRVFEALACGVPLVCAPWRDEEALFPDGSYLTACSQTEMREALTGVLSDRDLAQCLVTTGLRSILERHTCGHRVEQLLAIAEALRHPPDLGQQRQSMRQEGWVAAP